MTDFVDVDEWKDRAEMKEPGLVFEVKNAEGPSLFTLACIHFRCLGVRNQLRWVPACGRARGTSFRTYPEAKVAALNLSDFPCARREKLVSRAGDVENPLT
jgi:hypothetical protein